VTINPVTNGAVLVEVDQESIRKLETDDGLILSTLDVQCAVKTGAERVSKVSFEVICKYTLVESSNFEISVIVCHSANSAAWALIVNSGSRLSSANAALKVVLRYAPACCRGSPSHSWQLALQQ
jgi:hypothetical protein